MVQPHERGTKNTAAEGRRRVIGTKHASGIIAAGVPNMYTPEQIINMQRGTIEELRNEIEELKQELEDFHELKRQKWVKQQVRYYEASLWTNSFAASGLVASIACLALGLYVVLRPGTVSLLLTIAFLALVTFGLAYGANRERLQKEKQYIAEYKRQYGKLPKFDASL
jgi:hypothetical protein